MGRVADRIRARGAVFGAAGMPWSPRILVGPMCQQMDSMERFGHTYTPRKKRYVRLRKCRRSPAWRLTSYRAATICTPRSPTGGGGRANARVTPPNGLASSLSFPAPSCVSSDASATLLGRGHRWQSAHYNQDTFLFCFVLRDAGAATLDGEAKSGPPTRQAGEGLRPRLGQGLLDRPSEGSGADDKRGAGGQAPVRALGGSPWDSRWLPSVCETPLLRCLPLPFPVEPMSVAAQRSDIVPPWSRQEGGPHGAMRAEAARARAIAQNKT